MENKIIKQGLVDWKKCKWLQPDNLKKYSPEQMQKLKTSLKNNGFASPFIVWENKDNTWILDAHHRQKALIEMQEIDNINIPKKLPAIWINCKDKKDAKKAVLIYNSHYADIRQEEMFDFIKDINLDEIQAEIDIPSIDFNEFDVDINLDSFDPDDNGNHERVGVCPKCGFELTK